MIKYALHQVLRLRNYIFGLDYFIFITIVITFLTVLSLCTQSTFPVGGYRSIRRKPTTFNRALAEYFHMSGAEGDSDPHSQR